jgi:uncharacterized repeat protein (TIGR02543 family)
MKAVYLRWATMLALSLIIAACSSGSSPDTEKTSAVTIRINQQSLVQKAAVQPAAALAARYTLRITVSAPDYYHVYPDVPLTGTGVVNFTILVPNGLQRTFFVELLDENGLPVYFGSTTANLDGSPISLAVDVSNPFYTVTYDGNGNDGGSPPVDSGRYMSAQTVTVLGNTGALVKSGYSFAGWNTKANGSGTTYTLAQSFTIGTANVTLYAVWTANSTYIVTYNGNGNTGGSVPVDSTNYQPGQTFTVLGNIGNLVRGGYSFTGWNTQANGAGTTYTPTQSFIMGSADLTLYAMWSASPTYSVTYNGNSQTSGAVPVDSTSYQPGQSVTVLGNTGNLVKSGFAFKGWNTQANGEGTIYSPAQTFSMGSANITLYAMWFANPTYSVTYVGNGHDSGTVPVDANHYQSGQTVMVLDNTGNLQSSWFSFAGWNTRADGSGNTYLPGKTFIMGTANVTLYAVWVLTGEPKYTVTYDGNGNTSGSVPVDSNNYQQGQTVTVLGNPGNLMNGYSYFSGWNTQPDGSGTYYWSSDSFTMGTASVTLYAVWGYG